MMTCAPACRRGFSLAELVVALAIGALLSGLLFGALVAQVRLARAMANRAVGADAVRTAAHVLSGEARRITTRDVRAVASDSLAIRAFRAAGVVCGTDAGTLTLRVRGDRLPDPRKDSVVVIADGGEEYAAALTDARPAAPGNCAVRAGEVAQEWTLSRDAGDARLLLLFESGSYHIAAGALRYRLGGEGRQPLTADVFDAASGFDPGTRLAFTLKLRSGRSRRFVPALADGGR